MKNFIVFLLLCALCFSLVACAVSPTAPDDQSTTEPKKDRLEKDGEPTQGGAGYTGEPTQGGGG
jgi:hypothetical protein